MHILGAVLAGGQSQRFGSDKAEALIGGERLLDLAAKALAPFCDTVIVVGRRDPHWTSVDDAPRSGLGPLGGLCGALLYADRRWDAVLTTACDVPALPDDLLELLVPAPAVLASQPVIGLWPSDFVSRLLDFLATSQTRAFQAWVDASTARRIEVANPPANVNTRDDLGRLQ